MSSEKDKKDLEEQDIEQEKAREEKNFKGNSDSRPDEAAEDRELSLDISEDEILTLCREKICPECELLREQKNEALKALADSENFKKRITREKEEYCKYAISSFIEEVIPVIDNLELALEHGRKKQACKDIVQGLEMTLNMFHQVLDRNNLKQVGQEGEPFDPNYHEAMAQLERHDLEEGMVCQVMQKGYVLGSRLVRPAKVLVSKQSSPEKNE